MSPSLKTSHMSNELISILTFGSKLPQKLLRIATDHWAHVVFLANFLALVYYSRNVCHGSDEDLAFGQVHQALCCANCGDFRMSKKDRAIHVALAFVGVFGNVIPKYLKRDEASRHVAAIKANPFKNTLIVHIISGIAAVLGAGVFGLTKAQWLIPVWNIGSIVHDLSVHNLLPGHDGIFAIRVGNLCLAIMKTVVVLNVPDVNQRADLILFLTFGFMGTRIACTVIYIIYAMGMPNSLVNEYWYSIGLGGAQFYIYCRMWSSIGPVVFIATGFTTILYYHKRWISTPPRRALALAVSGAVSAIGLGVTDGRITFAIATAAYLVTFKLPFYRRARLFKSSSSISSSTSPAGGSSRANSHVAAAPELGERRS
jgi:hypothetical protein